jgi:hypothetical protein
VAKLARVAVVLLLLRRRAVVVVVVRSTKAKRREDKKKGCLLFTEQEKTTPTKNLKRRPRTRTTVGPPKNRRRQFQSEAECALAIPKTTRRRNVPGRTRSPLFESNPRKLPKFRRRSRPGREKRRIIVLAGSASASLLRLRRKQGSLRLSPPSPPPLDPAVPRERLGRRRRASSDFQANDLLIRREETRNLRRKCWETTIQARRSVKS